MAERRCVDCGVDISARNCRARFCVSCNLVKKRAKANAWREANPEYGRDWIQKTPYNRAQYALKWRETRAANIEQYREYSRRAVAKWRAVNPEKAKDARRRWIDGNPKKAKEAQRRWITANPEKYHAAQVRRRTRKSNAYVADVTATDIARMKKQSAGLCAAPWCNAPLSDGYHIDHIMPLAKGGTHEPGNVQLLCAHCNMTKHAKHPDDWLKEHGELPLERTGT